MCIRDRTAVVGTDCAETPVLSVRTDRPVEKAELFRVMRAIKRIRVKGPVRPGQVIQKNIAGTGADLVAVSYTHLVDQ